MKAGAVTFDGHQPFAQSGSRDAGGRGRQSRRPLPYDSDDQRVIEDKIKSLGETEEMQPGTSKDLTLDLKPGTYLLLCNVAGHYAAGMWTTLTVTE